MKKVIIPISLLCLIAVFVGISCSKTYNSKGTVQSLNQLFADLRTTPQYLSVTAGRDTVVYGTNGTMLHFYKNSFKDANGNILTSGTVYLQLVEMYKAGDMIRNRATTIANRQILQSAGEINITANMNGQTVYTSKYGIGFKQLSASTQPMELFYGSNANTDSAITWTQGNNTTPGTTANGTTIDTNGNYAGIYIIFDSCTGFGWVNCDHFKSTSAPFTNVYAIIADSSFTRENTQLFLIFPAINSQMTLSSNNTDTFSVWLEGNQVPIGLNYELAVIANKFGNYYYYEQSGVTTSGIAINVTMASITKNDLITRLSGL